MKALPTVLGGLLFVLTAAVADPVVAAPVSPVAYAADKGLVVRSSDGAWEFSPSFGVVVRGGQEVSRGALADRGFRLTATRIVGHVSQRDWHVQFHYQLHSDDGRISTGPVYVQWEPTPGIQLLAGQPRLPFNREAMTGFLYHQMIDRSIVNGRFSLQRDLGVGVTAAPWNHTVEATLGVWNGARIASANDNKSFETTARVVWNPLGAIPLQEGDLAMSTRPKLSLALAGAYNPERLFAADATKPSELTRQTSIRQLVLEETLRFRGFSLSTEAHARRLRTPKGMSNEYGVLLQAGAFLVPRCLEMNVRYARVFGDRLAPTDAARETALALAAYGNGHRLKVILEGALLRTHAEISESASVFSSYRIRIQSSVIF